MIFAPTQFRVTDAESNDVVHTFDSMAAAERCASGLTTSTRRLHVVRGAVEELSRRAARLRTQRRTVCATHLTVHATPPRGVSPCADALRLTFYPSAEHATRAEPNVTIASVVAARTVSDLAYRRTFPTLIER